MALPCRKQLDPVNEALRKDGSLEGPPNVDNTIIELLAKISLIHAGFLFDTIGKEALQKLCLCLSATKTSTHYRGWKDFGNYLGLNSLQIECINQQFRTTEDPAYYTLGAFVQKKNATLDKIIIALQQMERYDIIVTVADLFIHLASNIYKELQSTSDQNLEEDTIIRPQDIRPVPFVLQQLDSIEDQIKIRLDTNSQVKSPTTPCKQIEYGKKVMLTFSRDGLQAARDVARILRQETKLHSRIGVVILNDHISKVNSDPLKFIFSCFEQVDYIIPIITEGYLKKVSSNSTHASESCILCLDDKYVKYIYTLMKTNFIRDGCINEKIRCVVPDEFLYLTYSHPLMGDPLLQAWVKQSETEELGKRMLNTAL